MRDVLFAALIFTTGLSAGWYAHQYWFGKPHTRSTESGQILLNSADPANAEHSQVNANNPIGRTVQAYLRSGRYESATKALRTALHDDNDALARQLTRMVLQHARSLLRHQQPDSARELLTFYLEQDYRNTDALELLAEAEIELDNLLNAIHMLYDARAYGYRTEDLKRITGKIRKTVARYTRELREREDVVAYLQFHQWLAQIEPDHLPYILELAKAQFAAGQPSNALHSLRLVAHEPLLSAQSLQLLNKITQITATSALTEIPIRPSGQHYLVQATVNDHSDVTLLIDTGASLTIIKPSALERNGIPYHETGAYDRLNTVNGAVDAPILEITSLSVGDQRILGLRVAGIELETPADVDGLLGMDYLGKFQFFLDQTENRLRLDRR